MAHLIKLLTFITGAAALSGVGPVGPVIIPSRTSSYVVSSHSIAPTSTPSGSCAQQYNTCGPPEALCRINYSNCEDACQSHLVACSQDLTSDKSTCQALYEECLGPAVYNGSTSTSTSSSSSSIVIISTPPPAPQTESCAQKYESCGPPEALCRIDYTNCQDACYSQRMTCLDNPSSNGATCETEYEKCVGTLPGSNTISSSPPATVVTTVVTSFTTYCPSATTVTWNSQTYTVTSATTLTITDCPCTVVTSTTASLSGSNSVVSSASPSWLTSGSASVVSSGSPGWSTSGSVTGPSSTYTWPAMTTSSSPAQYSGAAIKIGAEGSLMFAAVAFLLI